ncbi:histidine kinase [Halopseudomonas phragmitis]|uniref:Histidine kinase n=1 Tax=Halopseudomonas phragmitis TaxID=1931241 RepID=A0A1V0B4M1_9GAMM|nr:hypothetical protein [Halopseudomonas phragmitis]AQZ94841.1 hypothetical protein BVH74_08805 [Halopseudomonas phragmitis]
MNRSSSPTDNLFLRWYAALRNQRLTLATRLQILVLLPLLLSLLATLWFGQLQWQRDTARQADAVGSELARQIAASVADPLAANDQLSLNILLAQWNQNPLIAHTSLYSVDNRIIAEAGQRLGREALAPGQGRFVAAVHFQDILSGQLQLSLAREPFTSAHQALVKHLIWTLLVLMLGFALLTWRQVSIMRRTLSELGNWYAESGQPAPGQQRSDEIGDLARRLAARRITDLPPEPEPEPESEPELVDDTKQQPVSTDNPTELPESESSHKVIDLTAGIPDGDYEPTEPQESPQADDMASASIPQQDYSETIEASDPIVAAQPSTALVAIRLGNQEALSKLPRERLLALLERYRTHVQQACQLYAGRQHTLLDGTSLLLFHAADCNQDELTHALCCGELLRILGHDLQIEIADTGIALQLQLGLSHSPCLKDFSLEELASNAHCQQSLEQVQYSRNLLLLDAELASGSLVRSRAVIRRLASQQGLYCVERLQEPYQSLLEQQLNQLYSQRH